MMVRNLFSYKAFIAAFVFMLVGFYSYAQRTLVYSDPANIYYEGLDLFSRNKFASARDKFRRASKDPAIISLLRTDAQYHEALSALELFNEDTEQLFIEFINAHPEAFQTKIAYYHLGNYYYRRKKYPAAIEWFEKVDKDVLSDELRLDYKFKSGHAYFEAEQYDKAMMPLSEVKETESKFTAPALYYYSHIQYSKKNYETALQGFNKLKAHPNFSPLVPYYLAQIFFLQEKYTEVISYAPGLLDSANTNRVPEISRIIGESHYRMKEYFKAIPYLEAYRNKSGKFTREDHYQLGFAYYRSGKYTEAAKHFKDVSAGKNDSLGQSAEYHLGDSYLKLQNKPYARIAFQAASKSDFDMEIKEDALYNFALLSYELAYNPYNEAVDAFKKYIAEFPKSEKVGEAFEYLVKVYLTTKNFRDALESIEGIKSQNPTLKEAYQKISFNRGVELFNNGKYTEALEHFEKSREFQLEKELAAESYFWTGEAYFLMGDFDKAIKAYNDFIFSPAAANSKHFEDGYYGLGYAYYKKQNYNTASVWFRKYVSTLDQKTVKVNDAYNRIGDCFFITKDYYAANDYYEKAYNMQLSNTDYSLFQRSLSLGLIARNAEKVEGLQKLLAEFGNSSYADDAKYELARTYLVGNNQEKALEWFKKLIADHPSSSFLKDAHLKMGLIFYNVGKNAEAINSYKKVIADYPGSKESRDAITGLKNIFIEEGKVEEFSSYIITVPFADLSVSAIDSATYEAADIKYTKGGCEVGLPLMKGYLDKFPSGIFSLHAEYITADCHYKNKDSVRADKYYKKIIKRPRNNYTEVALLRASEFALRNKDFPQAEELYKSLISIADVKANIHAGYKGLMNTYYNAGKFTSAMEAAEKLKKMSDVSMELKADAEFIIASSAHALEDWSLAIEKYLAVSNMVASEVSAESKYKAAEIWFKLNKYKEAEKLVFEIINQVPSYDYWIASSFILLADIYSAQGDQFQARQTLQSIIDNYEGPELVEKAKLRMTKIEEFEKFKESIPPPEPMEVEMNENDVNYKDLFND